MTPIYLQDISYCEYCGTATTRVVRGWDLIAEWYESRGLDPADHVRDMCGRSYVCYRHGGGYDHVDADLLGGDGDGRTRDKFVDWVISQGHTGPVIDWSRANGRPRVCRACAR